MLHRTRWMLRLLGGFGWVVGLVLASSKGLGGGSGATFWLLFGLVLNLVGLVLLVWSYRKR